MFETSHLPAAWYISGSDPTLDGGGKSYGPDLVPLGPKSHEALIEGTSKRGAEKRKEWSDLVLEDDYPINIEGAAFRADGTLLLGLRFPVAAEGHSLLVELAGTERLFEPGDRLPEVRGFWTVDAVDREGDMAAVRDLTTVGDGLHLVTGNIDSRDRQSVLIRNYPGGQNTVATHFRCTLPPETHSGSWEAGFVREFPSLPRVEGIAITDGGRLFYVTDEDGGVRLRLTRFLAD